MYILYLTSILFNKHAYRLNSHCLAGECIDNFTR